MSIAQALLPEFDQEMASTRRLLERTPESQTGWKPHAKSTPLGQLAVHIAMLPGWIAMTMKETELDINPVGGPPFKLPDFQSTKALVALFDENVTAARAALVSAEDKDFMVLWTLKNHGVAAFSMPRVAVVRSFAMNHLIHHRGQYDVYLRLRDVPLPQIYGPTADEPM